MLTFVHKDTHVYLPGHGHYRIAKGTLPGHSIGGDVFLSVYGDQIDQYLETENKDQQVIKLEKEQVDSNDIS